MSAVRSPLIEGVTWGRSSVAGLGVFRDVKLWPGGGHEWDWNETGTRHTPGIQPSDVHELLSHGSRIVVLSRGMNSRLNVCSETLETLMNHTVIVHVDDTRAAVARYNSLAEAGKAVGGLFHSTC